MVQHVGIPACEPRRRCHARTLMEYDAERGVRLLPGIYGNREVSGRFPALAEVAALIGGTQIQGRASIGGNLCNAAPSADAAPLLIAMRATCRILSSAGVRDVPIEDFFLGPGRNVLTA